MALSLEIRDALMERGLEVIEILRGRKAEGNGSRKPVTSQQFKDCLSLRNQAEKSRGMWVMGSHGKKTKKK